MVGRAIAAHGSPCRRPGEMHVCAGERPDTGRQCGRGQFGESGLEGKTAAVCVGFYRERAEAKTGNVNICRSRSWACMYLLQSCCAFLYV